MAKYHSSYKEWRRSMMKANLAYGVKHSSAQFIWNQLKDDNAVPKDIKASFKQKYMSTKDSPKDL